MLPKINNFSKPLQLAIIESIFTSLMTGSAMVFVIPFAIYLGANSIQIGLITALPALLAAWFQLSSLKLLKFYTRKKIVMATVFIQATTWMIIAILPFIAPFNQIGILIALTTVGTVIMSIGNPLWNSWVRKLASKEILGEYFGARNALAGVVVFLTTIICGITLDLAKPNYTLLAFFGIFSIGFIGRILALMIFAKIEDPKLEYNEIEKGVSLIEFTTHLTKTNFGNFILLGTFLTFTTAMISPYIYFHLLENLGLKNNYFVFTALISAATISSIISLPYWGRIIDKYGSAKLLKATTILSCFFPLFLIIIQDPTLLFFLQIWDGVLFSGLTLSLSNFIYETFNQKKIIQYSIFQAIFFGTATFFGTVFSGIIQINEINFFSLAVPFYSVCLIAVILRLTIASTLIWKVKDAIKAKPIKEEELVLRVLTIAPIREVFYNNTIFIITKTSTVAKKIENETIKKLEKAEKKLVKEVKLVEELTKKKLLKPKKQKNRKSMIETKDQNSKKLIFKGNK